MSEWPISNSPISISSKSLLIDMKQVDCKNECDLHIFKTTLSQFSQSLPNPYDYLQVQIYSKDLMTSTIEQLPATTFVEVLGTVGGLLGLWLGASMLSVLEFCELMANLSILSLINFKERCLPTRITSFGHNGQ